jgi:predicted DNA-binding transcriptional regulator AlpA
MSDDVLVHDDPPIKKMVLRSPVPAARKAPLLTSTAFLPRPKTKVKLSPREKQLPPMEAKRKRRKGEITEVEVKRQRREARSSSSRRHHLDRRAAALITQGEGDPNDLLKTKEVAAWLNVSDEFLEIGRSEGYGPKFCRLGPSSVRYLRSDVLRWLAERTYASTCEYAEPSKRGRGRSRCR